MKRAFYPGSFDPMTNGHLDILEQALGLFDCVVVGIGVHPGKTPLFSFEDRQRLVLESVRAGNGDETLIKVTAFDGLVVDAAAEADAVALVRGVRDATDFDYEMQMAGMNGTMRPDLFTVFLPARPATRPITATLVRQIAAMGGDVAAFVPGVVAKAIADRSK